MIGTRTDTQSKSNNKGQYSPALRHNQYVFSIPTSCNILMRLGYYFRQHATLTQFITVAKCSAPIFMD